MTDRKHRLLLLLLVSLALRSASLFTPLNVDRTFVDETQYAAYARNLATRGVYEARWLRDPPYKAHRAPLYPAFLALNHWVAGEEAFLRSARVATVILGSGIPILVFLCIEILIGRETRRKRNAAFVGGLVSAAYPYLLFFGLLTMTETLFTLLVTLASYLLLRLARKPASPALLAVAGIVCGLATLTRPGFALFPGIAALLLYQRFDTEHRPTRRVALLAILLVAYSATLAPWLVRNQRELGKFPLLATEGAEPLWIGANPEAKGYLDAPFESPIQQRDWQYAGRAGDEVERDRRFLEMSLRYIRNDPVRFAGLSVAKAAHLWGVEYHDLHLLTRFGRFDPLDSGLNGVMTVLLGVPFVSLALAFFATLTFAPTPRDRVFLTSFVAYNTVLAMVFFGTSRFHLPFVPQLITCSSSLLLLRPSDFRPVHKRVAFGAVALLYLAALIHFQPQ